MAHRRNTRSKPKNNKKKQTKNSKDLKLTWRAYGALALIFAVAIILDLGFLGTLFANMLRLVVGNTYQLGAVLLGILGSYWLLFDRVFKLRTNYLVGAILLYLGVVLWISASTFQNLAIHTDFIEAFFERAGHDLVSGTLNEDLAGGIIGVILYSLTYFLLGQIGSYLLACLLVGAGVLFICQISFSAVLENIGRIFKTLVFGTLNLLKKARTELKSFKQTTSKELFTEVEPSSDRKAPASQEPIPEPTPVVAEPTVSIPPEKKTIPKPKKVLSVKGDGTYELPSLDLLSEVLVPDRTGEKKKIKQNQVVLTETLKSFGVQAELKNIILGPAVTKYELHPAIGVKVSKFVSLADDLALALAAKDIRIEAPIPGKALVGIEVPNQKVATVSFKELMAEFRETDFSPLEVPLGRDISNGLVTADLAKMPHLLIAGSTGSGKSVAINVILTSLLMNCLPEQVKLVLIDPKKVELGMYHDLPHLLTPVVTEPRKAAVTLEKVVAKMQQRYEIFAQTGQRNLTGYNKMAAKDPANYEQMPYIVVVVDELADLMMTTGNEVEAAITRIAQMGRAAGIHLILATQRPSVDVITGIIKANVPSRMAFAVSSGTDSRTIIDQVGAEKLLGRGDMLYLPMGQNKPSRVQGAYIYDEDVQNVVDFIKSQAEVTYDQALEVSESELKTPDDNGTDELFDEVVAFITQEQKCSTSLIQRHFRIGYNRAANLVEELENRGMIGPQAGSKPRQVYLKSKKVDD
ncbi:FtsK/SpoIIIE family DNA translocase [Ligilactobacillus murinus]|uniref:DNA translocase FtsK n=1 Tax=Ligilactobacillus murinus TaxID=1622 RepID=A0AAD0KYY9_9LACO|nr:DNA translocase FtsK [Ligilactobacillus murinus]AWZ37784.1 cell division protein FtsK [Ligilactobacillus murinus]AWZ41227.1 cell division protein FtsK [Ligilactobacillus murinus]MCR1895282.1 DNA translocase FtsK [Ligilactobacillus murinus]